MPDRLSRRSIFFRQGISLPILRKRFLHQRTGLSHHGGARPKSAARWPSVYFAARSVGSVPICSRRSGDRGSVSRCSNPARHAESVRRSTYGSISAAFIGLGRRKSGSRGPIHTSSQAARRLHFGRERRRSLIGTGVRFHILSIGEGAG